MGRWENGSDQNTRKRQTSPLHINKKVNNFETYIPDENERGIFKKLFSVGRTSRETENDRCWMCWMFGWCLYRKYFSIRLKTIKIKIFPWVDRFFIYLFSGQLFFFTNFCKFTQSNWKIVYWTILALHGQCQYFFWISLRFFFQFK